ncbi:MAG TPA: MFS transporter [Actinospica sp.]|nr:MFS transporter [Actinospica sp.]
MTVDEVQREHGGLGSYLRLMRTPGARGFSGAAFVARMPLSMIGIGSVLLVQRETGSYAIAGTVSATAAFVQSVGSPVTSRLIDRHGQDKVAVPAALASAASLIGLILAVRVHAPTWTFYLFAALAGALMPGIGSMVRARWARIYSGTATLHTAYAFESVVDEVVFLIGPVLVTFLTTSVAPSSGLAAVAAFLSLGTLALCLQRGTQPEPVPDRGRQGFGAVAVPVVRVLLLVFIGTGTLFGSVEVITVAYAQEHGHTGAAGLLLAVYALGSMIAGIGFGAIHLATPLPRKLLILLTSMAATAALLPFAGSMWLLAAFLLLAGFTIAPTLITAFALLEELVPAELLTEGLTVGTTGLALGVTLGSSVGGPLIDDLGAQHAYLLSTGGAVAALVLAVLLRGGLRGVRNCRNPVP